MGTMHITLHARDRDDVSFMWKGNAAELEQAMAMVEQVADHNDISTDEYARGGLHYAITKRTWWEEEDPQAIKELLVYTIVYFILSQRERARKELGEDTAVITAEVTEMEDGWSIDILRTD